MTVAEKVSIIAVIIPALALVLTAYNSYVTLKNQKEQNELEFKKSVFLTNQKMLEEYVAVLIFIIDIYKDNYQSTLYEISEQTIADRPTPESCLSVEPLYRIKYNNVPYFTGISQNDVEMILKNLQKYEQNYFLYELKQLVLEVRDEDFSDEQNLMVSYRDRDGKAKYESIHPQDVIGNQNYKDLEKKVLIFSINKLNEIQEVFQKYSSITVNIK